MERLVVMDGWLSGYLLFVLHCDRWSSTCAKGRTRGQRFTASSGRMSTKRRIKRLQRLPERIPIPHFIPFLAWRGYTVIARRMKRKCTCCFEKWRPASSVPPTSNRSQRSLKYSPRTCSDLLSRQAVLDTQHARRIVRTCRSFARIPWQAIEVMVSSL